MHTMQAGAQLEEPLISITTAKSATLYPCMQLLDAHTIFLTCCFNGLWSRYHVGSKRMWGRKTNVLLHVGPAIRAPKVFSGA